MEFFELKIPKYFIGGKTQLGKSSGNNDFSFCCGFQPDINSVCQSFKDLDLRTSAIGITSRFSFFEFLRSEIFHNNLEQRISCKQNDYSDYDILKNMRIIHYLKI